MIEKCPLCNADLFIFRDEIVCVECNSEFDETGRYIGDGMCNA